MILYLHCQTIILLVIIDRALRKFGMKQHISKSCNTNTKLHSVALRGRLNLDWSDVHKEFIEKWNFRHGHVGRSELLS